MYIYIYTPIYREAGFPGSSVVKESACNAGDPCLIPGLGRSPGGGMATHSNILAWRILVDRGAWWATVHGGGKESDTAERVRTYTHSSNTLKMPCKHTEAIGSGQ